MGDCKVGLLKTAMPPLSNDAEFFPGVDKQWGLSFMINNDDGADRPLGRQPGLGGARQHLLLDRPEEGRRRRLRHADPAVRRREGAAAVLRLREGGLRQLVFRLCRSECRAKVPRCVRDDNFVGLEASTKK